MHSILDAGLNLDSAFIFKTHYVLINCSLYIYYVIKSCWECYLAVFYVKFLIIIIIKRGWQCKAGRERLTPYHYYYQKCTGLTPLPLFVKLLTFLVGLELTTAGWCAAYWLQYFTTVPRKTTDMYCYLYIYI